MFFRPRVNVVENDEGFSVEVVGRTHVRYREGERSILIDAEVLAPGRGIAIFTKSIKAWNAPHDQEAMSEEQKIAIAENIRRAIAFEGQPAEIV
jgi:hypothetical protein